MNKWIKRGVIFLGISVLCSGALWGVWQLFLNPYRGTVAAFRSSEKLETRLPGALAAEDFDYLVHRLKERHPACIHGLPYPIQVQYEQERTKMISSPRVSVLSLWQSSARLLALLHDSHTAVGVKCENSGRLDLSFTWEDEGVTCRGDGYDGFIVVEIGGINTANLYSNFLTQFSYELESWAEHSFVTRLSQGEFLSFIGVETIDNVPFLLKNPEDGTLVTAYFRLQDKATNEKNSGPNFSFSVDGADGVGVFTLSRCVYDEEYRVGVQAFFTAVRENSCSNVIVDLRGNPGGNSRVADEFIRYLPTGDYSSMTTQVRQGPILWKSGAQRQKNQQLAPVFAGNVYVLTSTDTFSSAMDFAVLISDNGLGMVVGESPSNMPSSYGDTLYFQTPNAGLAFTISHKYFLRPDATKSELPLVPDIIVPAKDALTETVRLIGQTE